MPGEESFFKHLYFGLLCDQNFCDQKKKIITYYGSSDFVAFTG